MDNFTKDIKTKYEKVYKKYTFKLLSIISNNIKTSNFTLLFFICFITFSYSQDNGSYQKTRELPLNTSPNREKAKENFENEAVTEKEDISSAVIFVMDNTIVFFDKNQEYNNFTIVYSKKEIKKNRLSQGNKKITKIKTPLKLVKNEKASTRVRVIDQANFKKISSEGSPFSIAGQQKILLEAIVIFFHHLCFNKPIRETTTSKNTVISKWLLWFYKHKLRKFAYYKKNIKSGLVIRKLTSRPPPLSWGFLVLL